MPLPPQPIPPFLPPPPPPPDIDDFGPECGNEVATDYCTNACTIARCGDAITQPIVDEECDGESSVPGTICDGFCRLSETDCGDSLDNDRDGLPDADDPDCAGFAFTTSGTYLGDLGAEALNFPDCSGLTGLLAADCICQETAERSTLPEINTGKTWLAYLADSSNPDPAAGFIDRP